MEELREVRDFQFLKQGLGDRDFRTIEEHRIYPATWTDGSLSNAVFVVIPPLIDFCCREDCEAVEAPGLVTRGQLGAVLEAQTVEFVEREIHDAMLASIQIRL